MVEAGRSVLLGNTAQNHLREDAYLEAFEEQRLAGLILTPVQRALDRLWRLRERGTSEVLVDRLAATSDFSSVGVNDALGGRLATEHLLNAGRRRIAFVGGPHAISGVAVWLRAARAALKRFVAGEITYVPTKAMDSAASRAAVEQLLALDPSRRPDGTFPVNDLLALGALQAATSAGVKAPEDLAIVGYGEINFAASAAIPLTSVPPGTSDEAPQRFCWRRSSRLRANDDTSASSPS